MRDHHSPALAAAFILALSLCMTGCGDAADQVQDKVGQAVSDAGLQLEEHINSGGLADLSGFWGRQASLLKEAMDGLYDRGFSAERIVRGITGKDTEDISGSAAASPDNAPDPAAQNGDADENGGIFGSAEAVDAIAEQISDSARQAAENVVTEVADAAEKAVDQAVEDAKESILDRVIEEINGFFGQAEAGGED